MSNFLPYPFDFQFFCAIKNFDPKLFDEYDKAVKNGNWFNMKTILFSKLDINNLKQILITQFDSVLSRVTSTSEGRTFEFFVFLLQNGELSFVDVNSHRDEVIEYMLALWKKDEFQLIDHPIVIHEIYSKSTVLSGDKMSLTKSFKVYNEKEFVLHISTERKIGSDLFISHSAAKNRDRNKKEFPQFSKMCMTLEGFTRLIESTKVLDFKYHSGWEYLGDPTEYLNVIKEKTANNNVIYVSYHDDPELNKEGTEKIVDCNGVDKIDENRFFYTFCTSYKIESWGWEWLTQDDKMLHGNGSRRRFLWVMYLNESNEKICVIISHNPLGNQKDRVIKAVESLVAFKMSISDQCSRVDHTFDSNMFGVSVDISKPLFENIKLTNKF